MKLLITGASGFIGRHVLAALPSECEVVAVYHCSPDFEEYVLQRVQCKVRTVQADLTSKEGVEAIAAIEARYEVGLLLAANSDPARSVTYPADDLLANAVAVARLLERIRLDTAIFFSSGAVYDKLDGPVSPSSILAPILPYAISKLTAERYLESSRYRSRVGRLFIIRFFGAYGPLEPMRKIYGRLVRRFALEKIAQFTLRGDGTNLIDAMYIDDTVQIIKRLLTFGGAGGTFDLATGHPLKLKDLVQRAGAIFGLSPSIEYEGEVAENIRFFSSDDSLFGRLGFIPRVALEDGLSRMAKCLFAAQKM